MCSKRAITRRFFLGGDVKRAETINWCARGELHRLSAHERRTFLTAMSEHIPDERNFHRVVSYLRAMEPELNERNNNDILHT